MKSKHIHENNGGKPIQMNTALEYQVCPTKFYFIPLKGGLLLSSDAAFFEFLSIPSVTPSKNGTICKGNSALEIIPAGGGDERDDPWGFQRSDWNHSGT